MYCTQKKFIAIDDFVYKDKSKKIPPEVFFWRCPQSLRDAHGGRIVMQSFMSWILSNGNARKYKNMVLDYMADPYFALHNVRCRNNDVVPMVFLAVKYFNYIPANPYEYTLISVPHDNPDFEYLNIYDCKSHLKIPSDILLEERVHFAGGNTTNFFDKRGASRGIIPDKGFMRRRITTPGSTPGSVSMEQHLEAKTPIHSDRSIIIDRKDFLIYDSLLRTGEAFLLRRLVESRKYMEARTYCSMHIIYDPSILSLIFKDTGETVAHYYASHCGKKISFNMIDAEIWLLPNGQGETVFAKYISSVANPPKCALEFPDLDKFLIQKSSKGQVLFDLYYKNNKLLAKILEKYPKLLFIRNQQLHIYDHSRNFKLYQMYIKEKILFDTLDYSDLMMDEGNDGVLTVHLLARYTDCPILEKYMEISTGENGSTVKSCRERYNNENNENNENSGG